MSGEVTIPTTDRVRCVRISASDFASLSPKDDSTMYFVNETGSFDPQSMDDSGQLYLGDKLINIDQLKGQGYGTCSSSSSPMTVTMSGYVLQANSFVAVRFSNAVPASATISINGETAKPIYNNGSAIAANVIKAGRKALFLYDGTRYNLVMVENDGDNVKPDWEVSESNVAGIRNKPNIKRGNREDGTSVVVGDLSGNTATGYYAYAEGVGTTASGGRSHAEGNGTTASGNYSHAEGNGTLARGHSSHAEGVATKTYSESDHAEGNTTVAYGSYGSHAEGSGSKTAIQITSGSGTTYTTSTEVKVGDIIMATINGSEKYVYVTAVSGTTATTNNNSLGTIATPVDAYVLRGVAFSARCHSEGQDCNAIGVASHAEGYGSSATASYCHAEGYNTVASMAYSHAEGYGTVASNYYSHAEGYSTKASSQYAHAEGRYSVASGICSHAEGRSTTAVGDFSHVEGYSTMASGSYSHAEGSDTRTTNDYEHAEGRYNVSNYGNSDAIRTRHSVGIGTGTGSNRKNAVEVMANGDYYLYNVGGYDGKAVTNKKTLQTVLSEHGNSIAALQSGIEYYDRVHVGANGLLQNSLCAFNTEEELVSLIYPDPKGGTAPVANTVDKFPYGAKIYYYTGTTVAQNVSGTDVNGVTLYSSYKHVNMTDMLYYANVSDKKSYIGSVQSGGTAYTDQSTLYLNIDSSSRYFWTLTKNAADQIVVSYKNLVVGDVYIRLGCHNATATTDTDWYSMNLEDNNPMLYFGQDEQEDPCFIDVHELVANKVTTISSSSTDDQYPSAKCMYDIIGDIETALNVILNGQSGSGGGNS